jgi:inner membrane protein
MSPETHLFASWLAGTRTTRTERDLRLAALAGILPDADGLGLLVDWANAGFGRRPTYYYAEYHHVIFHGLPGAIIIALALSVFATDRWRVLVNAFFLVHLHLLCDFIGSRGPSPGDLWPIYYLSPLRSHPMWIWRGQWPLDGWQNHAINLGLFLACLAVAVRSGRSFVGVFSARADRIFTATLQQWWKTMQRRRATRAGNDRPD